MNNRTGRVITKERRFPPPWAVVETPGGFRVDDRNGVTVAWVYARDDLSGKAGFAHMLTNVEAWKIARGIARLPELLIAKP